MPPDNSDNNGSLHAHKLVITPKDKPRSVSWKTPLEQVSGVTPDASEISRKRDPLQERYEALNSCAASLSHSRTRCIHSTEPDIIDKSKSIHEQNPKQISDQKPKTQQSRRDLSKVCSGSQSPNTSALKRSKISTTKPLLIISTRRET